MGGQWSNCCCAPDVNCNVRILAAVKNRNGFPVLYIASGINTQRFLTKAIDFSGYNTGGTYFDYHATLTIDERKNGKLGVSESSSLPGGSTLAANRTGALAIINSDFPTYKTTANGDYSESPGKSITVDWTYDGSDIVGAHFRRWFTVSNITIDEWWVVLSDEYTDTMLTDDVDELLAADAGGGAGLDGLADNTIMAISWNENNINSALTSCAEDASSLTGYTTTTGPTLVTSTLDPATFFAIHGIWWQHAGGSYSNGEVIFTDPPFSVFNCSFDEDGSMPKHGGSSSDWSTEITHAIRFNVNHDVCCEYTTIDTTSSSDTECTITNVASTHDHTDYFQPHPVAISNKNVVLFSSWKFTCPGYLTSGGCPCSNTP